MIKGLRNKFITWVELTSSHVKSSHIMYRFIHGSFWSLFGAVCSRIFSIGSTIAIARILGKESYGELCIVVSTIGMFGILAGFGLGRTANKYVAEFRDKNARRAGNIIVLTNIMAYVTCGIVMFIVIFLSPYLAKKVLNRESLVLVLFIGSFYLFFSTLRNVQIGPLMGFEAFKKIAEINIWEGLSSAFFAVPLVYFFGVEGAILSMTLSSAISYFLSRKALRRKCVQFKITFGNLKNTIRQEKSTLWKFAFPSMIGGMLVLPVIWITNTILIKQPNGYAELGLFNAANQWKITIMFIPQILSSVMMPIYSQAYASKDKNDFRYALKHNLKLNWTIGLPITVILITVRQPLSELFGEQFVGIESLIAVMIVANFLNIINDFIGTALAGAGRMWIGTIFNMLWAFVLLGATLILAPMYNAFGLALAYLLAYILHSILQMTYVEVSLAPKIISSQWKTFLFSGIVLIPSVLLNCINESSLTLNLALSCLSFFPLYYYIKGSGFIGIGKKEKEQSIISNTQTF